MPPETPNNVKVLVCEGSERSTYRFSRVPAVGEWVRLSLDPRDRDYVVRTVVHTPDADCAAEISVSVPPRKA